jgi:hypothetical protein
MKDIYTYAIYTYAFILALDQEQLVFDREQWEQRCPGLRSGAAGAALPGSSIGSSGSSAAISTQHVRSLYAELYAKFLLNENRSLNPASMKSKI